MSLFYGNHTERRGIERAFTPLSFIFSPKPRLPSPLSTNFFSVWTRTRRGPLRFPAYPRKWCAYYTVIKLSCGRGEPIEGILCSDYEGRHGRDVAAWARRVRRHRFPDQRLTRLEALRGMTIDPAYASFSEGYLGNLVPGKRADWVVLPADIMDEHINPLEIVMSVNVLATAIDGRVMYAKA